MVAPRLLVPDMSGAELDETVGSGQRRAHPVRRRGMPIGPRAANEPALTSAPCECQSVASPVVLGPAKSRYHGARNGRRLGPPYRDPVALCGGEAVCVSNRPRYLNNVLTIS